jgi:hypothetical protein
MMSDRLIMPVVTSGAGRASSEDYRGMPRPLPSFGSRIPVAFAARRKGEATTAKTNTRMCRSLLNVFSRAHAICATKRPSPGANGLPPEKAERDGLTSASHARTSSHAKGRLIR